MKNVEFRLDILFEIVKLQDEQIRNMNQCLKLQQTQIDMLSTQNKANAESIKILAGEKENEDEPT